MLPTDIIFKLLRMAPFFLMCRSVESVGSQCFKSNTLPNMYNGWKYNSKPFAKMQSSGPVECAKYCKLHSLCKVIDLNIRTMSCSLFATHANSIPDQDFIAIDAREWTNNILGICKDHSCSNNTVCEVGQTDFFSIPIGCTGLPPVENINITSFTRKHLWQFGDLVEYACIRGYYTRVNVTCSASGFWSEFSCLRFERCAQLKVCGQTQSKEYWIYVKKINSLQRLFCRLIGPVGPFLTLLEPNMASVPDSLRLRGTCDVYTEPEPISKGMGETTFNKVRIRPEDFIIKTDMGHYSNSTYTFQQYGRAGDCYNGNDNQCAVMGKFVINTRGTGLRLKSTAQWKTWGINGVIENITRSDDGHVIEGYCGGGCGGCEPDGLLPVEADPAYTPPFDSAELPLCGDERGASPDYMLWSPPSGVCANVEKDVALE